MDGVEDNDIVPWPEEAPDIKVPDEHRLGEQLTVRCQCVKRPDVRYTFHIGRPGSIWGTSWMSYPEADKLTPEADTLEFTFTELNYDTIYSVKVEIHPPEEDADRPKRVSHEKTAKTLNFASDAWTNWHRLKEWNEQLEREKEEAERLQEAYDRSLQEERRQHDHTQRQLEDTEEKLGLARRRAEELLLSQQHVEQQQERLHAENEDLRSTVNARQRHLTQLEEQNESLHSQKVHVQQELEEKAGENKMLHAKINKLENSLAEKNWSLQDCWRQIGELQNSVSTLNEQIEEDKNRSQEIERENEILRSQKLASVQQLRRILPNVSFKKTPKISEDICTLLRKLSNEEQTKRLCIVNENKLPHGTHARKIEAFENVWVMLRDLGDQVGANASFKDLLSILKIGGEKNIMNALTQVANSVFTLREREKNEEAKERLEIVLAMGREQLGLSRVKTANTLHELGATLRDLKQYEEAKERFEESLSILREKYGSSHVKTANTLCELGGTLLGSQEYEEAKERLEESLSIRRQKYGSSHVEVANSLYSLGLTLRNLQEYDEAKERLEESLSIRREQLGVTHVKVAYCLKLLALTSADLGDHKEAKRYVEELVSVEEERYKSTQGEDGSFIDFLKSDIGCGVAIEDMMSRYAISDVDGFDVWCS